jgi:hypothetical protein
VGALGQEAEEEMTGALGRRTPADLNHVKKYPFAAISAETTAVVEKTLALPRWHWLHDQGREGSCVGHAAAFERAVTNSTQNKILHLIRYSRRYDPLDIWNTAKAVDEWSDTNPGDQNGTSMRAAYG